MKKLLDATIKKALKEWADQHEPPANGKARLLLLAATSTPKRVHTPAFREHDLRASSQTSSSLVTSMAAEKFHSPWLWVFRVA